MDKKAEKILEFHKIKEQLVEHATSSIGAQVIRELSPSNNFDKVRQALLETEEGAKIIRLKGSAPIEGINDIGGSLKRLDIGGDLNGLELYQIGSNLRVSRLMKQFVEAMIEQGIDIPLFEASAAELVLFKEIEETIFLTVDESGMILDTASETLRGIRLSMRRAETRVREKLEELLRNANTSKMLSDAIITIRSDRFVIPVKPEYKNHFGGIVHDQSASGQTLFIEPQRIVELNNERRSLKAREKQEIERILAEISATVAEITAEMHHNTYLLSRFDFIFAKAKYGKKMHAITPQLNTDKQIKLHQARHPLLSAETVVANDIYLGESFSTIVITGPNTGGKTITLKTLGLLTLMAQAGLQIPAAEESVVSIFDNVFADIGDEQSIEQNLSTFSSHMTNIVSILGQINDHSLVLFDELGAGTDPQEGAALAIAILDAANAAGASVVATTHYPELKAYGYNRRHATNASVEFNVETLRPTYRLLIGVPGRSNAFDISRRLGLSSAIIKDARELIDEESADLNEMITSLEEKRNQAEKEYQEANQTLKDAEKLQKDLQKEIMQYYSQKDNLLEKANQKAAAIIDNAETEAEEVMHELRQLQLSGAKNVKEHELIDAKTRLSKAKPKTLSKTAIPENVVQVHEFAPGDNVRIRSLGQKGTLLERISKQDWNVQIGIIKTKVKEKDLEYLKPEKEVVKRMITSVRGNEAAVKTELDLRGVRYEEAIGKVDKYIDEALLAGYHQVSIIHGKGTGALRNGVTEFLKKHRMVKSIRFGSAAEGGNGVTIAELK